MRLLTCIILHILFNLIFTVSAYSHEVRPAYLEIKETAKHSYSVFWKVPAILDQRLAIHPRFPEHCRSAATPILSTTDHAYIEQARLTCDSSLAGHRIYIDGLSSTMTDVLMRYISLDQTVQLSRLTRMSPSVDIKTVPGYMNVSLTYFVLGIEHILLGFDHLLFVLALLLLVKNFRRLVITITAFTLAHSITLVAATLGWVTIPGPPIEAMIALSIVFVAHEIVTTNQNQHDVLSSWPWIIAFVFGLLHGFGFAGALHDIGLPQHAIPFALLFFNLGVEAGQLLFITSILAITAILKRWTAPFQPKLITTTAYCIGVISSFWFIERIVGFLA